MRVHFVIITSGSKLTGTVDNDVPSSRTSFITTVGGNAFGQMTKEELFKEIKSDKLFITD